MTSDFALLLAQTGVTACLAAWMGQGAAANWIHPRLNEAAVAMVMRLDMMERDFPDEFAAVRGRRVTDPRRIRLAFRVILLWETVAAALLCFGTLAMLAALFGAMPADAARGWAMIGALAFVVNWAGFLIGGDWFCYWYCHFSSQATHFFLMLWGTLSLILLALG